MEIKCFDLTSRESEASLRFYHRKLAFGEAEEQGKEAKLSPEAEAERNGLCEDAPHLEN